MEKNKKIFLKIIIILLIFFILFLIIRNAYSKYLSNNDSFTKTHISNWHILLNDEDITSNKDFSEIVEITLDENENIAENVIAPTSSGHINLVLESTDTELPFKYEIEPIVDENSNLPDFKIYGFSINNGEITELSEDEKTVTGIVIPPVDENGNFTKEEVINNFNLYLEWYDKEDNVLDNQNDVLISKLENSIATVKLKVTITQVKDDEINEIP